MAGGGGTLQKLFPGYKDKIWSRFPRALRQVLIYRTTSGELKQYHGLSVRKNRAMRWFHTRVLPTMAPNASAALPTTDYKRQMARGTLVEGTDMYAPEAERRLSKLEEPYTEEEQEERRKHRFQSFTYYVLAAVVFSAYHSSNQSRPIAWCADQEHASPPHYPFWVKSILHGHDIPSVRRGFEVYKTVCASCHSLKFFRFRQLVNDVYPEDAVKKIAASYDVEDGPNDKGEMFTRPGLPTDAFPSPYPNEEAAMYANGGVCPPDLTNISSARVHGPDYMFALLTGYHEPPAGVDLRPGMYWNVWFPGNTISMPPPLLDDMLDYEDGTPCNISQMAKDISNFFIWSAEPAHDERKIFALKAACYGVLSCIAFASWYRFYAISFISRRIDFFKPKGL